MPPYIAIAVGGRFHADRMALALKEMAKVHLYTSLPASRFTDLRDDEVTSFLASEVSFRTLGWVGLPNLGDKLKMVSFGRRVRDQLRRRKFRSNLFIGWSSFCLEVLRVRPAAKTIVVRDSLHLKTQTELLDKEYQRLGIRFDHRDFCLERELEEYQLADLIVVPSQLARESFLERGFSPNKVHSLYYGVSTEIFRPPSEIPESRLPLKVCYHGTLSVRKGVPLLLEATRGFSETELELHLIGPVEPSMKCFLKNHKQARLYGAMNRRSIATHLRKMDVFVLPSIEDGFGQAAIEAMASGLMPIISDHAGAAEALLHGKNGYVVPSGNAEALREKLASLIAYPERVRGMRQEAAKVAAFFRWDSYSEGIRDLVQDLLEDHPSPTLTSMKEATT